MKSWPLLAFAAITLAAVAASAQPPIVTAPVGPIQGKIGPLTINDAELKVRFPSRIAPSIDGKLRGQGSSQPPAGPPPAQVATQQQVDAIAQDIGRRFAGKSVGFSVTVMSANGTAAYTNGGAARRSPDAGPMSWTHIHRISVASVSKTITAAATIKVMAAKSMSLETQAWTLLPDDWTYSDSFKTITVRQLLAHNSGIRDCNITYASLRACAASDIPASRKSPAIAMGDKYSNSNYALLRLIIPRVHDGSLPATPAEQGARYVAIVNQQILVPANVGQATCAPAGPFSPLSYKSVGDNGRHDETGGPAAVNFDWTTVQLGEPWGDMTAVCGSQGWNLGSRQLAQFTRALFSTTNLLPAAATTEMRTQQLGTMYFDFGAGLTATGHSGWHPAGSNAGEVNTMILTFNNGISIGMIVNSRYNGRYLNDLAEAVRANIR